MRSWAIAGLVGSMATVFSVGAASVAPQTTISSDVLELQDNGAVSVFRGHVVLESPPYELKAREMSQVKATGIIKARGAVRGRWRGPKGERYLGTGNFAAYNPATKIAQLWGHAVVTRWETEADTSPVVARADHFTADGIAKTVLATGHVRITRGAAVDVRSHRATYVDTEKALYLWGEPRVHVHCETAKGEADFDSDRGLVTMDPRRMCLLDHVKGHIVPAP